MPLTAALKPIAESSFFGSYLAGKQVEHGGSGLSAITMVGTAITVNSTTAANSFRAFFTA